MLDTLDCLLLADSIQLLSRPSNHETDHCMPIAVSDPVLSKSGSMACSSGGAGKRRLRAQNSQASNDGWEAWEDDMPCIDHSPGKRARPKAGSIQDRIARSHLPSGPETAEELFDWPTFIVKQIAQCPQRIQRLSTFLEHGLRMTSDYAGMDCAAEALTQLEQAMEEVLLRPAGEPKSAFIFNYACDIARLPQRGSEEAAEATRPWMHLQGHSRQAAGSHAEEPSGVGSPGGRQS